MREKEGKVRPIEGTGRNGGVDKALRKKSGDGKCKVWGNSLTLERVKVKVVDV